MDIFMILGIFAVLLLFLIIDLWSNHRGRSYPKQKLTHHRR